MRWLIVALVACTLGFDAMRYGYESRAVEAMKHDHNCLRAEMKMAQATAELARVEGDIRAEDDEEECDLVCAANERRRDELMSEIRDYYKTLREHGCRAKDEQ